jgi:hypothetical protein
MENLQNLMVTIGWLTPLIIICVIWDVTWKLIGLWKAGRNNELVWFICIAIFNTLGILPIIYILLKKNKSENQSDFDSDPL